MDRLFRLHADAMLREVVRILGDPDEAADVTQDLFIRLLLHLESHPEKVLNGAYLMRAARNEARSALRRRRPQVPLESAPPERLVAAEEDHLERLVRRERRHVLEHFIETLPIQCGKVVRLVVDQQKRYREVARILSVSVRAVEKQMSRAYRLAKRVEDSADLQKKVEPEVS